MKITANSAPGSSDWNSPIIPGLSYFPNFIDAKTEAELMGVIDQQPWLTDLKRRVQHYGYRYDYKARNVTRELELGPLPDWLAPYCLRLQKSYFPKIPDQVIINEYQPGQGIAPHIDCVPCFEEPIASLSLGSSCVMDFINPKTKEKISILLEPCSLIALSGNVRYHWQHSIAHRKTDRYNGIQFPRRRRLSLTFRNVILKAQGNFYPE